MTDLESVTLRVSSECLAMAEEIARRAGMSTEEALSASLAVGLIELLRASPGLPRSNDLLRTASRYAELFPHLGK